MKKQFLISRSDGVTAIQYETDDPSETVATALTKLNERLEAEGERPVRWECSCLQKKCGACAMVINGRPGLACDARLEELGRTIRLEPLKKFPVIADLIVDRSVLYENLKTLRLWLEDSANLPDAAAETAYEASRCLQCGCCLEVCPNFVSGGAFGGMAAGMPFARLLSELPDGQRDTLTKAYREHIYAGCGKSLSCRNICPAGIDIDSLLASSNAVAVWKRFWKKGNHS